ncbi:hypothetical protein AB0K48_15605 [Nonomuraea sp. NPDC055795]
MRVVLADPSPSQVVHWHQDTFEPAGERILGRWAEHARVTAAERVEPGPAAESRESWS